MRRSILSLVFPLCVLLGAPPMVFAGDLERDPDGTTKWNAGSDGVVVEWGPDGDFDRIYAKYTQPVSVPNSRGVRTAKTIAEEKAKAAIIRFMEQSIATATLTSEVSNDIEQSSASSADGSGIQFSSTASSQMMTSLGEFTSSFSTGKLRGVIRLEEGYETATNEAWVKVGFSNRTMRAATAVRDAVVRDGEEPLDANGEPIDDLSNKQRSHIKTTDQKDW